MAKAIIEKRRTASQLGLKARKDKQPTKASRKRAKRWEKLQAPPLPPQPMVVSSGQRQESPVDLFTTPPHPRAQRSRTETLTETISTASPPTSRTKTATVPSHGDVVCVLFPRQGVTGILSLCLFALPCFALNLSLSLSFVSLSFSLFLSLSLLLWKLMYLICYANLTNISLFLFL